MLTQTIAERTQLSTSLPNGKDLEKLDLNELNELDEFDELIDDEDKAVLESYRQKRLAEIKATAARTKFGNVNEISGQHYVDEVTKAGPNIWVVLHLYASGIPLCDQIHHYMIELAERYPQTKFLRSLAQTCISNYPEENLPTIFVYHEGKMIQQFIGSLDLKCNKLTSEKLEYMLGKCGAIPTDITEDPEPKLKDKLFSDLQEIDF